MIALTSPQLHSIDEVIHGEALAVLRTLPDNSVDAIVCDPPAGIEFMGKEWDAFSEGKRSKGWAIAYDGEKNDKVENNGFYTKMRPSFYNQTRKDRDNFIAFMTEVMHEALRVLKPGGHAFVWALPRTSHWTGMALEDAGFEVRDVVTHLFGSGFPKSHDISAAIDRMQGAEREVIGRSTNQRPAHKKGGMGFDKAIGNGPTDLYITAPATPEALQWDGWGTALKPASEHWYLVRKPLSEKSIAANVLKWGTGAINIDASRISTQDYTGRPSGQSVNAYEWSNRPNPMKGQITGGNLQGRWPANLLLSHSVWCVPNGVKKVRANRIGVANPHDRPDHPTYGKYGYTGGSTSYNDSEGMEQVEDWLCTEDCPVRLLDEQSGIRKSAMTPAKQELFPLTSGWGNMGKTQGQIYQDTGGASRYFQRFYYVSKASRAERNRGCEGLPERTNQEYEGRTGTNNSSTRPDGSERQPIAHNNNHPTVKPVNLLRYLVCMITPPGGIVLDCFAGSGSTLVAAIHEGMHFIGIEMNDTQDEPYVTIARARIDQAFREVKP